MSVTLAMPALRRRRRPSFRQFIALLIILLPLSIPGILIAVVLVFILTFGDYAITKVAGPVYPSSLSVLMYTKAFTLQDWGGAACIGVVIIVTSLLFVAIYARTARAIQGSGR